MSIDWLDFALSELAHYLVLNASLSSGHGAVSVRDTATCRPAIDVGKPPRLEDPTLAPGESPDVRAPDSSPDAIAGDSFTVKA